MNSTSQRKVEKSSTACKYTMIQYSTAARQDPIMINLILDESEEGILNKKVAKLIVVALVS